MRRSMLHRKAVSVLPDPVGARISVCPPWAMAGQPCDWTAVGSGNDVANQARVGSEKAASAAAAPSAFSTWLAEGATSSIFPRPVTLCPASVGPAWSGAARPLRHEPGVDVAPADDHPDALVGCGPV